MFIIEATEPVIVRYRSKEGLKEGRYGNARAEGDDRIAFDELHLSIGDKLEFHRGDELVAVAYKS